MGESKLGKNPTVFKVLTGSIAEEGEISPGDRILTINGERIKDIFDYNFLIAEERLELIIEKPNGDIWNIDIEKDVYEDIGIEFKDPMLDKTKNCLNKCIFCFIDQLPKGLRSSLYFKDDDTRLSFLTGNYVTLTNIEDGELDRIIKYHMSPINISIHSTNPILRKFMLNNKHAGDIMEHIKKLADGGITINCQIVLCRNINDGKELDKTIEELTNLHPQVSSISVVPVGVTKFREGLPKLESYDREESEKILIQIQKWQKKFLTEKGARIVYPADEFYIMANYKIPGYKEYEDFPQLENGVGMVSLFKQEFHEYLSKVKNTHTPDSVNKAHGRVVSIATGMCAYKIIKELAEKLEKRYNNIKINVYPIKNIFLGENITVSGLLTGWDIINQLRNKELGQMLMLPDTMLKLGENIFLDDCTIERVEQELGVRIKAVQVNGKKFIDEILG